MRLLRRRPLVMALLAMASAALVLAAPVKRVALVFDDGPRPADAEPLLALLAREKVSVTFSLVGDRVNENPATAKTIAAAGHEIANHSQTHAHARDLDDAALDREVAAAQQAIQAATGIVPRWYWPPYLEVDDRVRAAVARGGLTLYTPRHLVVSMDYERSVPAAEILRRATTDVRDGSVILFHEWRAETREQLPAILAELRRQNCEFLTFSALHEALAFADNGFALVRHRAATPLVVSANDWPGVLRAAGDLQADIERVTKVRPSLVTSPQPGASNVILVGTLGRSELIDGLVAAGKLDTDAIRGRWEAFIIETVEKPVPGVDRALVIAGSDKRGTIYGVYEISQQIGVSPWYWWADVPVKHRDELFIRFGRQVDAGPVVKYRGIFLNDEAPALTGWAKEKFGGFNHRFYAHVFELLLRLRGNYLWPAMWQPQAFNDDDPENARLADEYGIVMGTSHHEPLMRAHAEWARYGSGPWDYAKNDAVLRGFWRGSVERTKDFENIQTLGMRGDGDEAMSAETNTALLERIVADQRQIIAEVTGKKVTETPQLWALYKEVQSYYEHGMRVPDDVTLLWCDDNWGNLRRLPTPEERQRPGGAGVYYHFDYVGGPRNYKWLNVTPITKVWEQMHLAWRHGADRIWIVNVGDLKPMEFPIEFFLAYAWDPARWPYEKLTDYAEAWAARQFGGDHASEIAALINGCTKLNRRRTPELLTPDTFSLIHYREAERVLAEWRDLAARAEKLDAVLPAEAKAAFLQLVLHPVQAAANLNEMLVAAGLNRLYATQGRASTNLLTARVRELFARDAALTRRWDAMLDGKWRHMMDQVHLGYTTWQQPVANVMPAVSEVQTSVAGWLALAVEGDPAARPGDYPVSAVAKLPVVSVFSPTHSFAVGGTGPPDRFSSAHPTTRPEDGFHRSVPGVPSGNANSTASLRLAPERSRWLEIFNRGETPVRFTIDVREPWLRVSLTAGEIGPDVRVEVGADWSAVPPGEHIARLTVRPEGGQPLVVEVPVSKPDVAGVRGFVEIGRQIAIEAPHFSRAVAGAGVEWRALPDFGRTTGGVTAFPVTAPAQVPGGDSPRLEYELHFVSTGEVTVELHCAPSLDFLPGDGLRVAVSFDDAPPQVARLDTAATPADWEKAVAESIRRVATKHRLDRPGNHVLKVWFVTPGVVLERIVVDAGGVNPSYLGPPESPRIGTP